MELQKELKERFVAFIDVLGFSELVKKIELHLNLIEQTIMFGN